LGALLRTWKDRLVLLRHRDTAQDARGMPTLCYAGGVAA